VQPTTESTWSTEANPDEDAEYQNEHINPTTDTGKASKDTFVDNGLGSGHASDLRAAAGSSSSSTNKTDGSKHTSAGDDLDSGIVSEVRTAAVSFPSKTNGSSKLGDMFAESGARCGHTFGNSSTEDTPAL
jgi:hypothetical protein